jgi:hypothetical protein
MSRLRFRISMSLDGFVAGPSQSVENPLGIGGMRLHEWVLPLKVWRAMQGLQGGEVNVSTPVVEESLANIGATVMGRKINLVPTLLGSGERLFDGVGDLYGLEFVRTVAAPQVTHLKFARP